MDVYMTAYLAILLSSILRVLMPALNKKTELKKTGEAFQFDLRYAYLVIWSVIMGFILSTYLFPIYTIPADTQSMIYLFCLAFGYGWGQADIMFKTVIDWHYPEVKQTEAEKPQEIVYSDPSGKAVTGVEAEVLTVQAEQDLESMKSTGQPIVRYFGGKPYIAYLNDKEKAWYKPFEQKEVTPS